MSAPYGCFEDVVGLSRTDCECYTDSMPLEASTSASDLYLDELPGLNLKKLFAAADCEKDAWDIMRLGVEHGTKRFKEEVLRNVRANTAWKRSPTRTQIGDDSVPSKAVALNKSYHGITLMMAHHIGGSAIVRRIGTRMKFTGTVDISVYEVDNDIPIRVETGVTCTANKTVWTTIADLELTMETETSRAPWYWFVFTPGVGQTEAANTRIICSTCTGISWTRSSPWFQSSGNPKGKDWMRWAMAAGTSGNDITDRENWSTDNATQGLMLDIEFKCNPLSAICDGAPDYEFDPLQAPTAHAIRYAAAVYVLDYVAAGSAVDRDALLGDVAVGKMRQDYEREYATRAEYVATVLSDSPEPGSPKSGVNTYSDCFTCKRGDGPVIKTIRA